MTNFNDPNLVFEHQLRAYVNREAERANNIIRDVTGSDYSKLNVEFNSADGGKWTLSAYVKSTSTSIKGAMLPAAIDLWIRMFHAQHNISVLPALIAGPSNIPDGFSTRADGEPEAPGSESPGDEWEHQNNG